MSGIELRNGVQVINAFIPLAEMFGYATDLRSRTQGRGNYTMQFDHFCRSTQVGEGKNHQGKRF